MLWSCPKQQILFPDKTVADNSELGYKCLSVYIFIREKFMGEFLHKNQRQGCYGRLHLFPVSISYSKSKCILGPWQLKLRMR